MLCSNCGKNSARNYVKLREGKKVELVLCPERYKRLYPERDEGDFFTQFLGNTGIKKSKACPNCGTRLSDYRKTGLLGCADCYATFREELTPTVRYIQWEVRHVGKRPTSNAEEKYDFVRTLVRERDVLLAKLDEAAAEGQHALVLSIQEELDRINQKLNEEEEE